MKIPDAHQPREIIDEFVSEIDDNKEIIVGDLRTIFFRDDKNEKKKRQVYKVPLYCLKFRKNNGRIASDVMAYERLNGEIQEATDFGQDVLRRFLFEKDKEKGTELKNTIEARGQDEPAVITSDGFLINGNRRKMILEILSEKNPKYRTMEVVILPGKKNSEADELPPSNYEIEQIESAYQFQTHGKSEYSNFDKALSIRRKLDNHMSIAEQLSYDGSFSNSSTAEKNKKIKEIENNFLNPLKCVDKYLERLGRPGQYNTIATAKGSKKGQWQAFIDYYNYIDKYISSDTKWLELGISKQERGVVEDISFKLIRARDIKGIDKKSHELMRLIPKILKKTDAKNELFELKSIKISDKGEVSKDAKDAEIKDLQWSQKNASEIIHHVRKSYELYLDVKGSETPIELLKAAFDKLNHNNMILSSVKSNKINEAKSWIEKIKRKTQQLDDEISNLD